MKKKLSWAMRVKRKIVREELRYCWTGRSFFCCCCCLFHTPPWVLCSNRIVHACSEELLFSTTVLIQWFRPNQDMTKRNTIKTNCTKRKVTTLHLVQKVMNIVKWVTCGAVHPRNVVTEFGLFWYIYQNKSEEGCVWRFYGTFYF